MFADIGNLQTHKIVCKLLGHFPREVVVVSKPKVVKTLSSFISTISSDFMSTESERMYKGLQNKYNNINSSPSYCTFFVNIFFIKGVITRSLSQGSHT